jgi:iron complex transport system ATP-binding protein
MCLFHPQLFKELDPDATMKRINEFSAVPLSGTYWVMHRNGLACHGSNGERALVNEIVLQVESLSTGYRNRPVIRNITLPPIKAGEITALVGPNAAGKSTLLRALAGLLPAQGRALLGGKAILELSSAARAELIGFMPQSVPQGAGLTVLEGMLSALHVGRPSHGHHVADQAIDVLSRVGIADIALEPLYRLSGGQRQLASLAQSIVREPLLLMLDEPTSALDLRHQFEVMNMVREYVRPGRIAVVVLHDLTFAARWADNIIVMEHGDVRTAGAPDIAITPEMLASVYGVHCRIEQCSRGFLQVIVDQLSTSQR